MMRWEAAEIKNKKKSPKSPQIVTEFLLFPKEIGGEWRWMETASWEREWWWGMFSKRWRYTDVRWIHGS